MVAGSDDQQTERRAGALPRAFEIIKMAATVSGVRWMQHSKRQHVRKAKAPKKTTNRTMGPRLESTTTAMPQELCTVHGLAFLGHIRKCEPGTINYIQSMQTVEFKPY